MIVILALHDANSAAPVDEFSDGLAALGDALNGVGAPCTLLRGSAQELLAAWEGIDTAARLLIDLRLIGDFAAYAQELIARGAAAIVLHRQALGPDDPALSEAARALLARLPHILVPSLIVADALVDRYEIPRAQVHLLSPGIADFAVAQREMEDGCAILTIGALVPESGHDLLLRALDRLFDLDWTLTIVGASVGKMAHEEELRALAQEGHCAGRVRFVDGRDSAVIEAAWRAADIFALTARWCANDAATRAALRRGVPVALCAGGAAAEVVSLGCGVIVAPGDAALYSKALRRMIFDRALRASMALAARDLGASLPDWPTQARALLKILTA